jgi:hypothetical protein
MHAQSPPQQKESFLSFHQSEGLMYISDQPQRNHGIIVNESLSI